VLAVGLQALQHRATPILIPPLLPLSSEDTEMNTEIPEPPVAKMSIWYGSSGPLPNRAQFVCAYEMGFGVDDFSPRRYSWCRAKHVDNP
jgi:hypothetical protein